MLSQISKKNDFIERQRLVCEITEPKMIAERLERLTGNKIIGKSGDTFLFRYSIFFFACIPIAALKIIFQGYKKA